MKAFVYHTGHTGYVHRIIESMQKHMEVVGLPDQDCDVFLSLQMGNHQNLAALANAAPSIPFVTYVWDCYEWIFEHGRGYDWQGYGDLCKASKEVWVPSSGQVKRLSQHWSIPEEKTAIIKAYANLFDYETTDKGYVCDPLRTIPDRHNGWAQKACEELGIPYNHGGRGQGSIGKTWDEYKEFIAGAKFLICPWYEASTGGMSLIEGYNLGKDVLICDSPYMGAKDYFGDRAYYFDPTYESFKKELLVMYHKDSISPPIDQKSLADRKQFCEDNFSVETIGYNLFKELERVVSN